ncbi:MAG: tyrosine recombinase [Pseudomonadota bacterium]
MKRELSAFLRYKNIEVGLATQTIEAYQNDLSHFKDHLLSQNKAFDKVTHHDLQDYVGLLHDLGYNMTSIARKVSALKQFFSFLYVEKILSANPAQKLKHPKQSQKLPDPLNRDEIECLIRAASAGKVPYNLRLVALLELAYGTGLRVSELVSLPYASISHNRDHMIVEGKGRKQRLLPLMNRTKKAIEIYAPHRLFFSRTAQSSYLFPSSGKTGHLTRVRFFQLLKALAEETSISAEKLSPHNFRHSYATDLLKGGADLKAIQSLLGHEHITTTEIYTHLDDRDIHDMVVEHHPLSKEKI